MSLAAHYAALDEKHRPEDQSDYADLVVPNGNASEPFHRWFHLKEGFSSRLLSRVLDDSSLATEKDLVVLDPFAGSGTTVLSGLEDRRVRSVYGIERNPFLHLVAQTKARARQERPSTVREFAAGAVSAARARGAKLAAMPGLSTFSNTAYFSPGALRDLLKLSYAIDAADGTELDRDIARVALAATIEPVSALRRDGRALRHEPNKTRANVWDEFERRVERAVSDIASSSVLPRSRVGTVILGDARELSVSIRKVKPSLIVFSPPYPNNIDYTEVYKLEAWFLGLIADQDAFKRQRLATLRSHPSVQFPNQYPQSSNGHSAEMRALLRPLLEAVPEGRFSLARERLVRGYFEDLLQVLTAASTVQVPGQKLVYIVGNSLHGNSQARFLIAADTMIAEIAESVGYRAERFAVARRPSRRRGEPDMLRESVVFLERV